VPALLDDVDRLEAEVVRLRAALRGLREAGEQVLLRDKGFIKEQHANSLEDALDAAQAALEGTR
jgi:hypothetical protein